MVEARKATPDRFGRILLVTTLFVCGWLSYIELPWRPLLYQHAQLTSINAAIAQMQQQRNALLRQSRELSNPDAILALAREQYQLVRPGQTIVEILPPLTKGLSAIDAADPMHDPLVAPSSAINLTPHVTGTSSASSVSFWQRFRRTIEFWH